MQFYNGNKTHLIVHPDQTCRDQTAAKHKQQHIDHCSHNVISDLSARTEKFHKFYFRFLLNNLA